MVFLELIGTALGAAAGMLWSMLWALILGFAISGAVQAFVPKRRIAALLGRPGMRELGLAALFGAASSSCSYAAASMSKTLFRKGAHIVSALAFMMASTNLVIELSAVLWAMMGWRFVLAELAGGLVLILVMASLMLLLAPLGAFEEKRRELAASSATGNSDAETETDGDAEPVANPRTREGWVSAASSFVAEGKMIWKDILIGVLVSGFLATFVPEGFWQSLFLAREGGSGGLRLIENVLVGPLVSVLSFVCSVGNIPLASVLFREGIGFGGTLSFIYADLIVLPLILVYRRYYGWRLALWITGLFYLSMAIAGALIDLAFGAAGWVPSVASLPAHSHSMGAFQLDPTFWLNLVFGVLGLGLYLLSRSSSQETEHSCCH